MKKILFLISSLKNDGPNKVLESMINGIDKNLYQIYIISFLDRNDKEYLKKLKEKNVHIITFDFSKKIDILLKGKKYVKAELKKINPDIIHSHGILPDIINVRTGHNNKITTIHNNMYEDYIYSFGKIKGRFFIYFHKYYLRKMQACVCCSKSIYNIIKHKIPNCYCVQNAIYNGTTNHNYYNIRKKIRNKLKIKENEIVYIYAGVISKLKNVTTLLESLSKTLEKNEKVLILGDGPLKNELSNQYNDNKNIIFLGFQKNVFDYLSAADVYCSFSVSEGFSISVLEALQYNNYLLLSDIPSHNEIFEIDKKVYLGEIFKSDNFSTKKNILREQILKNKNKDVSNFLETYLNSKKMMECYERIYNGD